MLEVVDAVCAVRGPEFVAIKLTPGFTIGEIEEADIDEKYSYIIKELNARGDLLFLHLWFNDLKQSEIYRKIRNDFKGKILAEGSLTADEYATGIEAGTMDLIGFGRMFISNPDLPLRLAQDAPLSQPDYETIYTPGSKGYTDYPSWDPTDPEGSVVNPTELTN